MTKILRGIWWTTVAAVDLFVLVFLFGPVSVQSWQIDAICSVLQKVGY
jgi:hypothetical protein